MLKNVTVLKANLFSTFNQESLRCILSMFDLMGQCNTSLAALFWAICSLFSRPFDAEDHTGEQRFNYLTQNVFSDIRKAFSHHRDAITHFLNYCVNVL